MHGFGSPSSIPGASIATFGPGFGTPTGGLFADSERGRGFGHPTMGHMTAESGLFVVVIPTFFYPFSYPRVTGFSHEVSDEGGDMVTLAGGEFPIRGPYTVRLFDKAGVFYGAPGCVGCYGGVPGLADALYANASREFLRFSMPIVPQGAYGVEITWNEGTNKITVEDQILVVAHNISSEADWFAKHFR